MYIKSLARTKKGVVAMGSISLRQVETVRNSSTMPYHFTNNKNI